jgi:CelD/BcsL family acetyltransferase involved in cellulose biosynthesis
VIRSELLDEDKIEGSRTEWTALAEERSRPFCDASWMLAWWNHVAPRDTRLQVVGVFDGPELIGLVPLFGSPGPRSSLRYRTLGFGTFLRGEPLARTGREEDVARSAVEQLETSGLLSFEGIPSDSKWPDLFRRVWASGRPSKLIKEWTIPAPVLILEDRTFDDWFAGQSSNFRQQMRRGRRKLEKEGALFRMTGTPEELERDLQAFAALHHSRWDQRGGSQALTPQVEAMLLEAGREMLPDGRFRLWNLEVDDRIVSSHLFVAAGGEVAYWLGGFDERWSAHKPSMQVLLAAIEHAWDVGDKRVDLGGGGQDYKYRFTEDRELLQWCTVVPPGLRHQATRMVLSTVRMRRRLMGRLSPGSRARLKRLIRR